MARYLMSVHNQDLALPNAVVGLVLAVLDSFGVVGACESEGGGVAGGTEGLVITGTQMV